MLKLVAWQGTLRQHRHRQLSPLAAKGAKLSLAFLGQLHVAAACGSCMWQLQSVSSMVAAGHLSCWVHSAEALMGPPPQAHCVQCDSGSGLRVQGPAGTPARTASRSLCPMRRRWSWPS